jgi:hypothetical protein
MLISYLRYVRERYLFPNIDCMLLRAEYLEEE